MFMPAAARECRLLIDLPASGAWNMAVDEVLLDAAAERGECSLRFYRWKEPTLSLGYFQAYADRHLHPASLGCPLVRRPTGGGAILHDRELTYSLALAAAHPFARSPQRLYEIVHRELCEAIKTLFGIALQIGPGPNQERESKVPRDARGTEVPHYEHAPGTDAPKPFLCFQRHGPDDVLFDNSKICGSAQRRRKGAVLQHGSVLLEASSAAHELTGVAEFAGRAIEPGALAGTWGERLAQVLAMQCTPFPLTSGELAHCLRYVEARYASRAWTQRR
jgi:lipoate-protein ligase A